MSATLIVVLVVVCAYLAAHLAFEWVARRFLIISGAEYLVLGLLLGPQVAGLIRAEVVGGFGPLMTLALGWIGAVIGAQFHLPTLVRVPGVHFRIAALEAVVTFALVSGAMLVVVAPLFGLGWAEAVEPAVALGAIAVASAPAGFALVSRRVGARGPVLRQLEVTAAIDAVVAVFGFGLLLSIVHVEPAVLPRSPTATEWAVIGVGIGVLGGALFHLFLGGERKTDRLFIALAGAIILVSGAAAHLRLSPLLPALLVGLILVNTSPARAEIKQVLGRVERPLYFALLVFAGAAWQPGALASVVVVVAFRVGRVGGGLLGGGGGGAWAGGWAVLGAGGARALLGQGGLAVAIGLNYRLLEGALLRDVVFTAALVSMLVTDMTSARLAVPVVRRWGRVTGVRAVVGTSTDGSGGAA